MTLLRIIGPLLTFLTLSCAATTPPTEYDIRLDAPQTQMVDISMTVRDLDEESIEVVLPTWRPGRYVILDPASTIRSIRAFDADTVEILPIAQIRKNAWRITTRNADNVRIDYRIYANSLGDRTRHVDDTHAFLSGSSVFLFVPQRRKSPLHVNIDAPDGWTVATGLAPIDDDPFVRYAPDYDVLVDSPLEIGEQDKIEFQLDGAEYEIVFWGEADYDRDELIEDFSAIIQEQVAIFGSRPYDRYVFITHVGRGGGGGTEHLNSTIMQTSRASLEQSRPYKRFLGLVSHEFFHTWNVKQLRPAGMHPYDYDKENYTPLLWVAEGSTVYYSALTLARAGLTKPDDYIDSLAGNIDAHRNRPARHVQTLEAASFNAWNQFARSTPDNVNSIISFYSEGALATLLLDLTIRQHTDNAVTFDDVMRTMYERYPLTGPGYTTQDLIDTINELTGSDLTALFDRHIRDTHEMPFEDVFSAVGLELIFEPADHDDEDDDDVDVDTDGSLADNTIPLKPYLGINLSGSRVSSVRADGPAWPLGFVSGDELVAIDGQRIQSQGDLDDHVEEKDPGDVITITFFRRDELQTIDVTLGGVPDGSWILQRLEDPSEDQKIGYESWIGHPWPDDDENDEEGDQTEPIDDPHAISTAD